ncbi:MAG TPA: DUF177 domain-containing protein [Blastocatellia bacterium]|nr:DUF177 domain-containing protein [Blastocatellia bacterium]
MNINVAQVSEDEGLTIHHLYPEGEPALVGSDNRLIGRPELHLQVTREGGKVQLVGELHAAVSFDCDRCLKPLTISVEQAFDLTYVPPGGLDEEKELGDADLQVAFYTDQVIDLDDLVREQTELALPMSRLCNSECRGLCPVCGANLNDGDCLCTPEDVDPRWAALSELKA